ncbi:hypothetical protein [Limnospira indica]|uniref:Uncharacterized protein n=2 Tax=Limnospira indica PCC 8005 TaxID=376219 RepID=A0A9P1KE94_9CYAN|nr:hypothetical protein [Limnospira indica]CDM94533.1 conserved protein of unknown function [Limnospira indica PCC 8005]
MVKDSIRSSTSKNVGRSGGVSSGLAGDLGDQTSSAMDFGRGLPYARERDRAGIPGLVNPWDPIARLPRGINPEDHGRWKREDDARRIDEEYRRRDVKKEATVKEPPNRDEPKGGKKPKGGSSGGGGSGRSFGGPNSGDKIDDDKGGEPRRPKPGNGDIIPDPRDYPVDDDCGWQVMIFWRKTSSYNITRKSISTGMVYYIWNSSYSYRVNKINGENPDDGFVIEIGVERAYTIFDGDNERSGTDSHLVKIHQSPFYWMSPSNEWYRFAKPERCFIVNDGNGNTHRYYYENYWLSFEGEAIIDIIWTPYPSEFLKVINLWKSPSHDRPKKDYQSGVYYPDSRRHGNFSLVNGSFWFPIRPTRPSTMTSTTSWEEQTVTRNDAYELDVYSDCGDYPVSLPVDTIGIPDMNEECCGMIRRIYEFLDPESFPAEMPEKITVNAENPENRIKRINTLPEWLMYRFDIDDERWGEFEVKVEIDDVNLMTKAEEKAEIKLPNLAEAIAEIFGMVMEIAISHQVTQNAVLTALHEAGLAHAAAFKAGREVSEIIDYLGFATEEKYETIKTAFTPEADNFEELLEPNESKVKITNQKDAKETLQTTLNQIKEIFAIVRAQGTLQVNSNDPAKDILADLTRLYDSMKKQDDIREQETNKVQELLKKDFPDIKIETELIDGDNPLRGTL